MSLRVEAYKYHFKKSQYDKQKNSCCWLRIYQMGSHTSVPIMLLTELPQGLNGGFSVTNGCEQIATKVANEFFPLLHYEWQRSLWFEYYPKNNYISAGQESCSVITFQWSRKKVDGEIEKLIATRPSWIHINQETISDIVKFNFDDDGNGFPQYRE